MEPFSNAKIMVMIMFYLILLGLVLGSFINALVWRLRKQDELVYPELVDNKRRGSKDNLTKDELSIARGRSMCPECHHMLAAKDLVPVFSWIWLRGKCRYCHKPISWQYPLVELLTGVLFAVSYVFWPLEFDALGIFRLAFWLIFVTGFVALAVYDLHWFELPDRIVWPLLALAVLQTLTVFIVGRDITILAQALLGAVVITGVFGGLYAVSKGKWIGFGDVKLSPVLGLLAGTPSKAFLVIFFASVIGTLVSLPLFMKDKNSFKKQIPFGPALLLATLIVVLFGTQVIDWYMSFLY